jgi:hypothetical protein
VERRNYYRSLVLEPVGKQPLEGPSRIWGDKMKANPRDIGKSWHSLLQWLFTG